MEKGIKAIIFDWGDTLMRDSTQYQGSMAFWEKVEAIPGVVTALEAIHKHYICCVASNAGDSDQELMGVALNRVGLRSYFQHLFTSRELGFTKPDLNFFKQILSHLNLQPEECMMIGNDYEKDIIPAKAVGMRTILFNEEPSDSENTKADATIYSMEQLYEAIIKLS